MTILIDRIEKASTEDKNVMMMGDANLCSNKWKDSSFLNKKMANLLTDTLDACGLFSVPVGPTFLASQKNNVITESWLDHVYLSENLKTLVKTQIINNSSSDHLPVTTCLRTSVNKKVYKREITKRSMKNFTNSNWNEVLASKDWNEINLTQDLDEKVVAFNKLINESLDEVAPYKTFKVRTNHKFGLSEETKELMKNREHARKMIQKAESSQKQIWNEKYKKLRNVINAKIRKENYDHNKNICQDITYLI